MLPLRRIPRKQSLSDRRASQAARQSLSIEHRCQYPSLSRFGKERIENGTHEPTGPDPVVTNTVSPGFGDAYSFQPQYAVKPKGTDGNEGNDTRIFEGVETTQKREWYHDEPAIQSAFHFSHQNLTLDSQKWILT